MNRSVTVALLLAAPVAAASPAGADPLARPAEAGDPIPAVVPAAAAAPEQAPPSDPPWANKFFLPDIASNPGRAAPPVVVHDFGTVPHGTLCAHKFTITNIYDVPMQVIDITKSCGCLEAYPPMKVLQPNEQAEFVVTMDTSKFKGPNAQTMKVTFGPQYVSTAILRFEANSRTDVQLSPGRVHFGTVALGAKVPPQTVTVDYHGRQKDWKITGFVPPTGPIDVDVKQVTGGFAIRAKYQVTVSLRPDAPAGPVAEVVSLKTNDPTSPVVQVNVTGLVQAPLTLTADTVRFGKVAVGRTATFRVIVRATGGAAFVVQPVADAGDGISVETLPAASPTQILTVKFQPTRPGVVRKDVRLETSLGGGAAVTIRVEGEGEGEPLEK
jgi:hypothetical protein